MGAEHVLQGGAQDIGVQLPVQPFVQEDVELRVGGGSGFGSPDIALVGGQRELT
ncbi:hypothetical protein AB6O49_26560 [Streptomyces sp. SBR177]